MARHARPRTTVTKDKLEDLYSETSVRIIVENADLGQVDISCLRKSLISAVHAYLDLLSKEQRAIKASRAKRKHEYYWQKKGLHLHTSREMLRITRRGRQKETSIFVLISTLGFIYNKYTGRWPTRQFDRETHNEIGFGRFVFEATVPIFQDQCTLDYYVKRYVTALKHAQRR